jgi:hypothetical protein
MRFGRDRRRDGLVLCGGLEKLRSGVACVRPGG